MKIFAIFIYKHLWANLVESFLLISKVINISLLNYLCETSFNSFEISIRQINQNLIRLDLKELNCFFKVIRFNVHLLKNKKNIIFRNTWSIYIRP